MKGKQLITHLCQSCKDGRSVSQLHSQILKNGFLHDSLLVTKLNSYYANYLSLEHARKLFDEIPHRTVYLWNSILRSHCREKQWETTLYLFNQMVSTTTDENDKPDNFTVPIAIKACAELLAFRTGKAIHGLIKKNEKMNSDLFVGSALVELYSKCGEMGDALLVFEEFSEPDVVLWTSMVTGYQHNGDSEKALSFFSKMTITEGLTPDRVTLVSVVSACSKLLNLLDGKSVHSFTIKMGLDKDPSLVNSLLNLYSKTCSIRNARNLFEMMEEKDVISWSSIISCYVQSENADKALSLFNEMIEKRYEPNSVTIVSILQACAASSNVNEGRKIHELAKRKGFELHISVSTALLDMYMKCSCIEEAADIFGRIPHKDVVCWAALLSGYALNGLPNESLGIFRSMLSRGTRPDTVIMVKVLMACAELGILHQALCFHGFLVRNGFNNRAFVGAALIDLYSKCGNLGSSIRVFEEMDQKDVVVWSSMMAGYGIHGFGKEAIRTFNDMIQTSKIIPNQITFLSILSACGHTGLVEEGLKMFDKMVQKYKIEPSSEHYSVMVDLLGRTGNLEKAMEFIEQMRVPPGAHVWGALLGACRIHRNVEIGEKAAKKLFRLEPNHAGYYVLLSNIYAVNGKWDNVARIRTLVKDKGLKRVPGQSLIEVKSKVHTFSATDSSHPEFEQIYRLLRELEVKMREESNVHDVEIMLHCG